MTQPDEQLLEDFTKYVSEDPADLESPDPTATNRIVTGGRGTVEVTYLPLIDAEDITPS